MKWNFNPPSVTSHKFYNNWLRSHRLWLSSSRGCGRQRKHVWTEIHLAFLEKVEEYMEVLILFLIWCCWLNLQVNLLISRRFLPIWPVNLTECETTLGSGFSKYVHFHCLDGFGNLDPLWTPSVGCSHSLPRCILLLPGMRHMEARKKLSSQLLWDLWRDQPADTQTHLFRPQLCSRLHSTWLTGAS